MKLTMGLDWSEAHHDGCVLDRHGRQIAAFQISQTSRGFLKLAEQIDQLGLSRAEIEIGVETGHKLGLDFLLSRDQTVYIIAPNIVNRNRERYRLSGAGTDQSDGYGLADMLRTDRARFAPWRPDSLALAQLKAQLRLYDTLTKTTTAYHNRLRAVLLRAYPQALGMFSELTAQISLTFLSAQPSLEQAAQLSFDTFAAFCPQHHSSRADWINRAQANFQQPLPPAPSELMTIYQDQTRILAPLLLSLPHQKKHLLGQIHSHFDQHPDQPSFASLPGAGDLLAPQLLVLFGHDRDRCPTPGAVQQLAGTCPVTDQSGKKRHVYFRPTGNHFDRQTAPQFAKASIPLSAWARGYFNPVRQRGHAINHPYRCLANRCLALSWKLWQTNQSYNESYHLQQVARHGQG